MKGDARSTKLMGRSGRPRDVWSYGVCLLEALIAPDARVFHLCASESNGYIPASRRDLDAAAALEPLVGKLVLDCLAVQAERRPTFTQIRRSLEEARCCCARVFSSRCLVHCWHGGVGTGWCFGRWDPRARAFHHHPLRHDVYLAVRRNC